MMRNVGLVLSGGMAKGAYQIGALQAINEVFRPSDISFISGASIGALNAYAYLTQGLDKGVDLWNTVNSKHNRRYVTALLKSCFLQEAIKNIISDAEIKNTFYVPLVNLKKRTLVYSDIGKVPGADTESYLRASVAMPVFNPGVSINGECFYDGALIDNIPIHPILKHRIDYIICIYFDNYNYIFESRYLDNKIVKINFSDDKIVSSSLCFKNESIKYMIEEGYAKTKRMLGFVFANGVNDTDSIYKKIDDLNAMNTGKNVRRITGDMIVDNMNKVTKKFMRKIEVV